MTSIAKSIFVDAIAISVAPAALVTVLGILTTIACDLKHNEAVLETVMLVFTISGALVTLV